MDLDPARYGDDWAADYDELTPIPAHITASAVDCISDLARGGSVLELAVGTGRIALPLAERGLKVTGTDASSAMLAALAEKDPHGLITVRQEAMPEIGDTERYSVVVCAYNAILGLFTQDEQVRLFANAADHLADGGYFAVESLLLDPRAFVDARPLAMNAGMLMARFGNYDVITQRLEQYYLIARPGPSERVSIRPDVSRVPTLGELDLMARMAGLTLHRRSSDWAGTPLTRPGNQVSIYRAA
jgi:SAM-dependent methyltransferase